MFLFIHRIRGWLRLGGTSGSAAVQAPCSSHPLVGQNNVQMALDLQGRTFCLQLSVSLTVHVCSCAQMEPHVFSVCPLPLVLSLGTTDKGLPPSSLLPPLDDGKC